MSPTSVDAKPLIDSCSSRDAQTLIQGGLEGKLSVIERGQLASFSSEKRRLDWLCGRIAAKTAASRWLTQRGFAMPLPSIEIVNDESGQPSIRTAPSIAAMPFVSISHCAAGGIAAAFSGPIGIDWEPIAERQPGMLPYFIHESEQAWAHNPDRQTTLWTIKEAALKLLGLGLRGGPTQVRWIDGNLELDGAARARWREMGSKNILIETRIEGAVAIALAYTL